MASLLEDIEDIIGSHDGSCDSGIQASPQASLFQPNYGKQARTRKYKSCYSRNVMENKFFLSGIFCRVLLLNFIERKH